MHMHYEHKNTIVEQTSSTAVINKEDATCIQGTSEM